ncbi:TerC family protein [Rhizobium leguminosarum]|uniref:TerC family protein n=1 Tax=Rhizobium leguminosarum TaxID=384 RepID=UPI002E113496|nr:TerC family protein [Rhizobium leguminosarum]
MPFEWFVDPAAWAGLATLILLEVVLGIDNLMFVAILAAKLPHHQRDKARYIGLGLAVCMRICLLAAIGWIVTLKNPVFTVVGHAVSVRDLIMAAGGTFLIYKALKEIAERLESRLHHGPKGGNNVKLWQVVVQIVVLDAVFSLDSVITAVGVVPHLEIQVTAVIIAMGVMLLMSKFLMNFVSKHPTVVMLCLCFLMLIGFSLILDGLGVHVPHEYVYAMIAFAILIESLNLMGRLNRKKHAESLDPRDRAADYVLAVLGVRRGEVPLSDTAEMIADHAEQAPVFSEEEKDMIEGVLTLADRPAKSIMTPSTDIDWIDLESTPEELKAKILSLENSRVPVGHGSLDAFVGVADRADLLRVLVNGGELGDDFQTSAPLTVHESMSSLKLMERLRTARPQVAMVVDEHGAIQGMITPTDLLEAIAGQFSDDEDDENSIEPLSEGEWLMRGWAPIADVGDAIGVELTDKEDEYAYSTLAGYILNHRGEVPERGEVVEIGALKFEIVEMDGHAVEQVRVSVAA